MPDLGGLPSRDVRVSDLDGLLTLEVRVGLSSPTNRALERAFDVVATTLGGLAIAPLLLALAAAVRASGPGPILYGQTRIGRHGAPFTIWKFRTMVPDADAVLQSHLDAHPHLRAEWDADHKRQRPLSSVSSWLAAGIVANGKEPVLLQNGSDQETQDWSGSNGSRRGYATTGSSA